MSGKSRKNTKSAPSYLKGRIVADGLAGAYGLLTFVLTLAISWLSLATVDFGYGFWHDHGGVGEAIAKFAPQNRYKAGFVETSREQRVALFHAINVSVHTGGTGLAELTYETPTSGGRQQLLREPEIVHLEDVAHLIDFLLKVAGGVCIAWLIATVGMWYWRRFPALKAQLLGVFVWLLPAVLMVFAIGPETVFNFMHVQVFPPGHQWFFYYQESLMSTMMFAPNLFGWIALVMVIWALILFIFLQGLVAFLRHTQSKVHGHTAPLDARN